MTCHMQPIMREHADELYRETLMRAVDLQLDELLKTSDRQVWEPDQVDAARKALTAEVVKLLRADARMLLGL